MKYNIKQLFSIFYTWKIQECSTCVFNVKFNRSAVHHAITERYRSSIRTEGANNALTYEIGIRNERPISYVRTLAPSVDIMYAEYCLCYRIKRSVSF